ncbi:hypothetical protein R84B8_02141 [Treponema sp. R8-4-B8]
MANNIEFAPVYYDSGIAGEIAYKDYQQKIAMTRDITDSITRSAESISSRIVDAQIATTNAIYNNTQQMIGAFNSGFSDMSRQIGSMGTQMSLGFAAMNSAVQKSAQAICDRLDTMNDILNNPSLTKTRELFRRAQVNYDKGFYEEARNDLLEALSSNKTDYISWFLLGKTYLFGASEFSNVIDLDAAVDALKNAVKFITPDARKQDDARILASEMYFYLGLAQQTKALDLLHAKNNADCKSCLEQAAGSYGQSYDYSAQMLEARYNRARCKALLGDVQGALADLENVVLADRNYCIKVYLDKDFSSITEQFAALVKKLKNAAFIAAKKDYDNIKTMLSELASLGGASKATLPATFTEELPYFDTLDFAKEFKLIISIVEKDLAEKKASITEGKAKVEQKVKMAKARERIANYKVCIAASGRHAVGLKADGMVVAVGVNKDGQCSDWRNITAVAAAKDDIVTNNCYTVGLKADGTVVAVGDNESHQCNVSGWRDIVGIAAFYSNTVGLKADGTVVAVGNNNVSGWRDIVAVAAGYGHTIGLKADGTVVAVGDNKEGQCNVSGWRDIVGIAAGWHTVGLKADGTVVAVGDNKDGQCNVSGWRDIVGIAAYGHTVGLKADGTVVAVGSNEHGRCNVSDLRDIVGIAASDSYTFGLKADGTVVVVGKTIYGDCSKVSGWRDIGPISEEKVKLFKENIKKEREAEQWQAQGLCKYCGGKLGGLFSKKCKSCGKEN